MARTDSFQAVPMALIPVVSGATISLIITLALVAALVVTSDGSVVESANTIRSSSNSVRKVQVVPGGKVAPEGVGDSLQGAQGLQRTNENLQQPSTSNELQNAGGGGLNID